jgi:hypothetical protein
MAEPELEFDFDDMQADIPLDELLRRFILLII